MQAFDAIGHEPGASHRERVGQGQPDLDGPAARADRRTPR
jgi:hypothetical protein